MILTGPEIHRAREIGHLVIEPFDLRRLNPNSYNYALGSMLLEVKGGDAHVPVDLTCEDGILLLPKKLYLGHTAELIGSSRYVTTLLGRSSIGRLGLFLNITADLGHIGSFNRWTLELTVVQPLRVYGGMQIGQVAFWETMGRVASYAGRYQDDLGPVASRDPQLAGFAGLNGTLSLQATEKR